MDQHRPHNRTYEATVIRPSRGWTVLLCAAALPGLLAAAEPAVQPELARRVARVERGLLSAVIVAGARPAVRALQVEMARANVPGLSVAVLHEGRIEWAKGYGLTRAGGATVDADTLFQAGSISKPVTAFGALRLVQDGRLALDDDVNTVLKGWQLPAPEGQPVSLRQLLSHTGGVTVHGFPGYAAGASVPSVDEVLRGAPPAVTAAVSVDMPPGTRWRYSGGGYTVIQRLMTDRSGEAFSALLAREVLQAAGMHHSRFDQPLASALLAHAALPHDTAGRPVPGGPHVYPELAAAGLWSTPSDLLRFAVAVQRSAAGEPDALLSREWAEQMLRPGLGGYGLGFEVGDTPWGHSFAHGGSNEGYENYLVAYDGRGEGVAVMTNGAQGNRVAGDLIRSIAVEYGWPSYRSIARRSVAMPRASARRLVGTYEIPQLGEFAVLADRDGLALSLKDGVSERLYAASASEFFVLSQDLVLKIEPGSEPIAGRIVSGPFDLPFKAAR